MALSTDPYKGVRDFYPGDAATQQYIFNTWAKTAESFGYLRYDASVLEPSELYKAKGAENEEIVNEQTYTFADKGDREVTLRPEMTPTVARMVAGRRRELQFPLRWYSIPNLFRYERSQRGRLREHWQLNCDIFGSNDTSADVEIIYLASELLKAFGAKDSDFEIRINDRRILNALYQKHGLTADSIQRTTAVIDKKMKMSASEFSTALKEAAGSNFELPEAEPQEIRALRAKLEKLGVSNTKYDASIVRGFAYYTGTIFEIFDTHKDNNRSLLGGGRYDNLTGLFGGDPIPGIGFGMGDVTMRDFLEVHGLLPSATSTIDVVFVLPDTSCAIDAEGSAAILRQKGINVFVDISGKKLGDQIARAEKRGARYIVTVGDEELKSGTFTLKELSSGRETHGTLADIASSIKKN